MNANDNDDYSLMHTQKYETSVAMRTTVDKHKNVQKLMALPERKFSQICNFHIFFQMNAVETF